MKQLSKKIILASKSSRRQHLLKDLGFDFTTQIQDVEEIYPPELKREQVAEFLSELKSKPFQDNLKSDELVITSDTIVCLDDEVLGKPKDRDDAIKTLLKLSGKVHEVITGVTISSLNKKVTFSVETSVTFKDLTLEEIVFYIDKYKPFDKAGSYGIQEWIGYIGIEKIEGSYFNVMGLPVKKLYEELLKF